MSSFNHVEKIKYTSGQDSVVSLGEYILFEDTRAEEKFAVFKFFNNLNQKLYAVRFEVSQFDGSGALLEKSVLLHENFEAEANAPFVPNAKMRINFLCEKLGVKLLFAAFDRVKWENGEFKDNSYKFDRYAQTVPSAAPAPARVAAPAPKKSAQKQLKYGFSIRNVFRKNIAKFPKVFNVFVILVVLGFVIGAAFLFKNRSEMVYLDGFDLRVSDGRATICGYDGGQSAVTVPDKVGDYKITAIAKGAFSDRRIEKAVFGNQGELRIESGAFTHCDGLQSVSASAECGVIYVSEKGFENCPALKTVDLPTARLSRGSFSDSKQADSVCFDSFVSAEAVPLKNLFGGGEMTFKTVSVNCAEIPASFLEGVKAADFIARNPAAALGYGALKNVTLRITYGNWTGVSANSYYQYDSCDLLVDEVVSVNGESDTFILPSAVTKFEAGKFYRELSAVRSMKIVQMAGSFAPTAAFFQSFPNLERLSWSCASPEAGALQALSGLKYLELHAAAFSGNLDGLFGETTVSLETLVIDCNALPAGFFGEGRTGIVRAILLNTRAIGDLAGLSAQSLYLPATLAYDGALFGLLASADVNEFLFEGDKPQGAENFPDNYVWNYTGIKDELYEF